MATTLTPIDITTSLPIINGYVAVPDLPRNKRVSLATVLLSIPEITRTFKVGQTFIDFPAVTTPNLYSADYFAMLRALA